MILKSIAVNKSCKFTLGSEIYCKAEQTKIEEAEDEEIEEPRLNKRDDSMREVNQEKSGGGKSETMTEDGKEKKKEKKEAD